MVIYQSSAAEERERILATFRAGRALCKASLLTLLYAVVTFLLVVVHILTFIIHFSIGMLMMTHAFICLARLLLVQWQEATRTPLVCVAGRLL
jgi:hypothetical protein